MKALVVISHDRDTQESCALWEATGGSVAEAYKIRVKIPNPRTYIGLGNVEKARETDADAVFCDMPINPVNRAMLEKDIGKPVFDRTDVVLQIFSIRASTAEGKLQVRLASMMHQKHRLTGHGIFLDKQRGGLGKIGGGGEKFKELAKRTLDKKINSVKQEIEKLKIQRSLRRKENTVALVGYTNVGKTAALACITKCNAQPCNKLFATLDPKSSFWYLGDQTGIQVVDTVGFVRNLPHVLVDAFHATLEEAVRASIVIHLNDATDPEHASKSEYVKKTLMKLGVSPEKILDIWTKSDLASNKYEFSVSSKTGAGWDKVAQEVKSRLGFVKRKFFSSDISKTPKCCSCKPVGKGFVIESVMSPQEWTVLRKALRAQKNYGCGYG